MASVITPSFITSSLFSCHPWSSFSSANKLHPHFSPHKAQVRQHHFSSSALSDHHKSKQQHVFPWILIDMSVQPGLHGAPSPAAVPPQVSSTTLQNRPVQSKSISPISTPPPIPTSPVTPVTTTPLPPFPKLITCDVDGTLITSTTHTTSPITRDAVRLLRSRYHVPFVPATGRNRAGALNAMADLGVDLQRDGPCPGVFLQGLIVYGKDGNVVYERTLGKNVVKKMAELARNRAQDGLSCVAYSGDRILCEKKDDRTRRLVSLHEPETELVNFMQAADVLPIHKIMFMDTPENITALRTEISQLLQRDATLTQALPDMLEILPPGASKGDGVAKLLKDFGVEPEQLMAIGDAENDLEMLAMAGISVAMGNALDSVKKVAKYETLSNNENGVAEALYRFTQLRLENRPDDLHYLSDSSCTSS